VTRYEKCRPTYFESVFASVTSSSNVEIEPFDGHERRSSESKLA
jgi:hypothetical protein